MRIIRKKKGKWSKRSYLDRWARLTALVSVSEQGQLYEVCTYNGGKPGTIATELARIAATIEPSEYNDFLKSVKSAAGRHQRKPKAEEKIGPKYTMEI